MKTTHRQRFEVIFWSFMSGLVGASIGYYYAAATAAETVKAALAE